MNKIIVVSGPVIVEDGKVLLDIQGDDDFWKFCGGRARDDEYLSGTAQRRAKEELGIETQILDENPYINLVKKDTPEAEDKIDIILIHFLTKRIGDIKPGADIREWAWHDVDNLPDNLGPNIIPALKHFGFIK